MHVICMCADLCRVYNHAMDTVSLVIRGVYFALFACILISAQRGGGVFADGIHY